MNEKDMLRFFEQIKERIIARKNDEKNVRDKSSNNKSWSSSKSQANYEGMLKRTRSKF